MPVWEPHNQGVAGLTDPDDPILLHQELDRENERQARQAERERALLQREQEDQREAARTAQLSAAGRLAPGAKPEPAPSGRREPSMDRPGGKAEAIPRNDVDSVVTTGNGRVSPSLMFVAVVLVLVVAAVWMFAPGLTQRGEQQAPQVFAAKPTPGALPVAPDNGPLSNPRNVGQLGERVSPELLQPDPLSQVEPEELPSATDSLADASALVASIPAPAAEIAAAESLQQDQETPLPAEPAAGPDAAERLDQLAEALDALSARLDAIEHTAGEATAFRLGAMEQRLNVVQEQAAASQASAERAEALGVAARDAARRANRPVAAAPKPAPKPQPKPAAAPVDPSVQLLAIDSWAGEPSVIVGTTAIPTRTRTLAVGDTINGITLRAVDPRLSTATFDLGQGETLTLAIPGAGGTR